LSSIRVTYSGLISFLVGLASVITGLVFTLIVTRQLTQEEFGTWSLIGSLTVYVLIFNPIVNYWVIREIARGEESGKTSLIVNNLFSVLGIGIYLIIIHFVGIGTGVNQEILIFASILIPVEFVRTSLTAIGGGYKPQIVEYGFITWELTKIPLAIVFVYSFDWGLEGAILATTISSMIGSVVLLIGVRSKIKGKFNFKFLKKWLKLFWIPSYPQLNGLLQNSDVLIFTLITGSVSGVAYWAAAFSVSRMVRHASKIGVAIYPKLLSGGKKEFFQENLIQILYFSFPLAAMSLVFAEPALFALNPLYIVAAPVVIFMVPLIFFRNIGYVLATSLSGIEKVDTKEKASFRDYLKSKLFFLPTLSNIQGGIYAISLLVILAKRKSLS